MSVSPFEIGRPSSPGILVPISIPSGSLEKDLLISSSLPVATRLHGFQASTERFSAMTITATAKWHRPDV
eukprot:14866852-Heterocapsa_arctica.AAC.1